MVFVIKLIMHVGISHDTISHNTCGYYLIYVSYHVGYHMIYAGLSHDTSERKRKWCNSRAR